LESKKEEKLNIENIDNITKEITSNIKKHSSILFYVDHKGEVIMMTTGDMTKVQKSVASRMLVVIGNHSFILKIVLGLEILFEKVIYKVSQWFKSIRD
jgi:hypothetical protein